MKKPNIFKRLTAIIMVVVMSVTFIPLGTIAGIDLSFKAGATGAEEVENVIDSGTCGDNLTWTLDEDGTLIISGTGEMYDGDYGPWVGYESSVKKIEIGDGVTSMHISLNFSLSIFLISL